MTKTSAILLASITGLMMTAECGAWARTAPKAPRTHSARRMKRSIKPGPIAPLAKRSVKHLNKRSM